MQRKRFAKLTLVIAGFCAEAIVANAQAPAGPKTQTTAPPAATSTPQNAPSPPATNVPRTRNLAGSWNLNKDESTMPRDRDRSGQGGSGRSGGGYPGGGRGGYGGGMHRRGMSDDERKEVQELMRPSETLEFTQDSRAIKMTDDYDRH